MQPKYMAGVLLAAAIAGLALHHLQKPGFNAQDVLIIGTNAEYQPYTFLDNGKITGFDIDLIEMLAQRIGKKIIIKDIAFTTLLPELQLGSIHVVAAGLSPTPARAKEVDFLTPHHYGTPFVLIAPKAAGITTLDDLQGKTVIANEGFTADTFISNIQGVHVLRLPTVADAFLTLASNRADAFISAKSAVRPFFELHGKEAWTITAVPGTQEATALAVSKKYPELYQLLQKHLDALKSEGKIAELAKKWGFA